MRKLRQRKVVVVNTINKNEAWWLRCKESACNAGDPGLIPGSGRFPGEGNGYPLQYSCLRWTEEPGGLQSMGSQESDTTKRLNNNNPPTFLSSS